MSCIEIGCAFLSVFLFAMEIAETIHHHEDLIIITILLRRPAYLDKARETLTERYQQMPVFHRAARILHEDAHDTQLNKKHKHTHNNKKQQHNKKNQNKNTGINIE